MSSNNEPLFSKIQTKKIPATSFMRSWSLGTSQAKIGAAYLLYGLQKNFLSEDKRRLAKEQANLKAALQLLGSMGYLRGAIMKFGQLVANYPQIVGQQLVDVLDSLHFEAPAMHYSLIREVFLDELGREPEEVFASFDRRAFAAASLGQVHRARLRDGTEVAVKIQYPDIGRTINADFKSLSLLIQPIRFSQNYQMFSDHLDDARDVFLKEIDYLSEANYMEENRKLFSGTGVVVPRSFPELSSSRVLTMEYLPGQHLRDFLLSKPSQDERNHFGELLSFALVRSFFRYQTIYSDLHPGNFIFMRDGRLGFIDFGCYRKFSEERWHFQLESELGMIAGQREAIEGFLTRVSCCNDPAVVNHEWLDRAYRQLEWVVKPVTTQGIFDFADREYVEEGVNLFKEIIKSGYGPVDSFYNWTNRALLGHRSLLYQLGSKIDYGTYYREELNKAAVRLGLA